MFSQVSQINQWNISDLQQMPSLTTLGFDSCIISTIPTQIGLLTNLKQLHFYESAFAQTPPLPTEIGMLQNLEILHNTIRQPIITEIGMLRNLTDLELAPTPNQQLPTQFGQLPDLRYLTISSGSGIGGTLPNEFSNLTQLSTISISNNSLTGTIPSSWANLTTLWNIDFSYNSLSGKIPFTNYPKINIVTVTFSHNLFDDVSPFGGSYNEISIDLSFNNFSMIPNSLMNTPIYQL